MITEKGKKIGRFVLVFTIQVLIILQIVPGLYGQVLNLILMTHEIVAYWQHHKQR